MLVVVPPLHPPAAAPASTTTAITMIRTLLPVAGTHDMGSQPMTPSPVLLARRGPVRAPGKRLGAYSPLAGELHASPIGWGIRVGVTHGVGLNAPMTPFHVGSFPMPSFTPDGVHMPAGGHI